MLRLPQPRSGLLAKVRDRPIAFSFWPMFRTTRRYGLQSHVFTTNPWALIRSSIADRCTATSGAEALAAIDQAEGFFGGAEAAGRWASKPLLLYYCCSTAPATGRGLSPLGARRQPPA
jgi:hypothetical protein